MNTMFTNGEEGVSPLGDDEQPSSALPVVTNDPTWYHVENSESTQFVPLSASGSIGAVQASSSIQQQTSSGSPSQRFPSTQGAGVRGRKGSRVRLLVILSILVLLLLAGSVSVFAHAAPNIFVNHTGSQMNQGQMQQPILKTVIKQKSMRPTLPTTSTPKVNVPSTSMPGVAGPAWFSGTLSASCSAVGLKQDQGADADLEAVQFTLREERISFRNINSLQSSTTLMTPQTKALRFINDRRSTDAFARKVLNQKLVQAPENLQPTLKQCQQQGGQTFAWAVVTFERVTQCVTNDQGQPCPPNPNFAPEMNMQNQPIVHSMAVLMVFVPSGQANAPLWLGWSVVDYMIDQGQMLPTLPPPGQV